MHSIILQLVILCTGRSINAQCFDTKFLRTVYTALLDPDCELPTSAETLCRTACAGNSSCGAYTYNTSSSVCLMSGQPRVVRSDDAAEEEKNVFVKKRFIDEMTVYNVNRIPIQDVQREFKYRGCYIDASARDLNGANTADNSMTIEMCQDFCKTQGYNTVGVQYYRQCFCGNGYGTYGEVPEEECNTPCSGNQNQICGGSARNSVYQLAIVSSHEAEPEEDPVVELKYVGCYIDGEQRDIAAHQGGVSGDTITVENCVHQCKEQGYLYAGMQVGTECYCDNNHGHYGTPAESACNTPCLGNTLQICGGYWLNSVWTWEERSPAKYDFLRKGIQENRRVTLHNGVTSTDNYYIKNPLPLPAYSWTMCFWWKFERFDGESETLISMAIPGDYNYKIITYKRATLRINGRQLSSRLEYHLPQLNVTTWMFFCFEYDYTTYQQTGQWRLRVKILHERQASWGVSKEEIFEDSTTANRDRQDVAFVLYQEQDSLGGGFQNEDGTSASISCLNMWEGIYPSGTLLSLAMCKNKGDVFHLSQDEGEAHGAAQFHVSSSYPAEQKREESYCYWTSMIVPSLTLRQLIANSEYECAAMCMTSELCEAANYYFSTGLCELGSADEALLGEEIQDYEDAVHYSTLRCSAQ